MIDRNGISLSLTRPICSMGKKKKEMKRKKKRFFKFFLQLGNQSHNMANNKQIHNRIDWDLLKSIIDSLRIVQINCEFVNNLPIIDRERENVWCFGERYMWKSTWCSVWLSWWKLRDTHEIHHPTVINSKEKMMFNSREGFAGIFHCYAAASAAVGLGGKKWAVSARCRLFFSVQLVSSFPCRMAEKCANIHYF